MQTTLRVDDEIYRQAKAEAAREGITLTRFFQEALRLRLKKTKSPQVPIRFRTYRAGEKFPFDDRRLKDLANREQELHDTQKLKS